MNKTPPLSTCVLSTCSGELFQACTYLIFTKINSEVVHFSNRTFFFFFFLSENHELWFLRALVIFYCLAPSYMSEVPHHNNVIFLAKITSECWKRIFSPTDMQVALTIKFLWGLFLSILIHVNLLFYRYGKFKTVFSTPFLCMLLSSWWAKVCEDKVLELMEPDLLTQLVTFHHPQRYFTILQISGNGEGIET